MKDNLWQQYKRFITLNASVRGPFLPMYSENCWTDSFLNRVTDRVKARHSRSSCMPDPSLTIWQLVGLSINCRPRPHVQAMLFATDGCRNVRLT